MALGKRQTIDSKNQWLPGVGVGDREEAEADFRGRGNTLYGIIMMVTRHYAFIQIQTINNGPWVIMSSSKCTTPVGNDRGSSVCVEGCIVSLCTLSILL